MKTIKIPDDLHYKLKLMAFKKGSTLSDLVDTHLGLLAIGVTAVIDEASKIPAEKKIPENKLTINRGTMKAEDYV